MLTPKETPLHEHISKKNEEEEEEEEDFKDTESLKTESTISSEGNAAVPASDLEKKKRRTERFGVPVQLSEEEKRNSRSERFVTGPTFHESNVSQKSEEQKKKARAERFGLPSQSLADEEAKKKARLARFAAVSKMDTSEEEKKKARAIRFSPPTSGASSQVNGSANSEQKTAIVGKANGGT